MTRTPLAVALLASATHAAPPAPEPQRPEFEAIARRLVESANPYLGTAQIADLQARLDQPGISLVDLIQLNAVLAQELNRLGRSEEAVEHVERAMSYARQRGTVAPDLYRLRGQVYLRQAEIANCVSRHNADCCIFPITGGGIHELREPALQARQSYLDYLGFRRSFHGAWLLNIINMALGEYPDGVPQQYRIPLERYDSAFDPGRFMDVAPQLGLDSLNLCGGCVVDDFTGDGLLDIVTSSYDPETPLELFVNNGDGTFTDRSAESRADDQLGGLNLNAADYDNDGDLDVLVLRGAWLFDDGQIRNSLLRNDDGVFVDVTRDAGLADPARPTQAAAWFDLENDGDLDLFIGNESRAEWEEGTGNYPSQLFRNNGDGTFTDIAAEAGVTNDRYCKGVAAGDYDNDGDMDLYLSNIGQNRLFRNNGDATFTDVAPQLGVTHPEVRSFAPWFFDYDNDGRLDIFVSAYDADIDDIAADALGMKNDASFPRLYRNNPDGTFTDVAVAMGLGHPYLPMGANFGDLDNDGWLDIYLGTGEPGFESLMPNVMLRNDAGNAFQDCTVAGGFGHLQKGHGIAFADIDDDGDQDIFHQLGGFFPGDKFKNALFENPGHDNHALYVKLVGTTSNRQAVGARIAVEIDTPEGPRTIHRAVGSVSSFGGSPLRQEIGLADATAIRSLTVTWPTSDTTQTFTDVPLDALVLVTEGRDTLERRELHPAKLGGNP